jgi:uncharacterized protein
MTARLKGMPMPPKLLNGKICYIEMPTTDIARSADFYKGLRPDHSEARRRWGARLGKTGLLFYIMADSVAATVDGVVAQGVRSCSRSARTRPEITARFHDPGGTSSASTSNPPDVSQYTFA